MCCLDCHILFLPARMSSSCCQSVGTISSARFSEHSREAATRLRMRDICLFIQIVKEKTKHNSFTQINDTDTKGKLKILIVANSLEESRPHTHIYTPTHTISHISKCKNRTLINKLNIFISNI